MRHQVRVQRNAAMRGPFDVEPLTSRTGRWSLTYHATELRAQWYMHTRYRRVAVALLAIPGLLVASTGVAAADRPTRISIDPVDLTFAAGVVCAFPLEFK